MKINFIALLQNLTINKDLPLLEFEEAALKRLNGMIKARLRRWKLVS
jgi:hypothetical protein